MTDPRLQKLAGILVNYSLNIQPGDKVLIESPAVAAPLICEAYREVVRAGAHPTVRARIEGIAEIGLRESSEEQLRYVSDLDRQEIEHFDVILTIWADENTKALSGIDPRRMALRQEARAPLFQRYLERLARKEARWCGTQFPAQANAQDAGMSLTEYEDFVFGAGLLDSDDPAAEWRKVHAEQQRIADFLAQHDEVHIVAPDTDLTYRAGGRTWINASGEENFPDGEVFTSPIEDSTNGTVRFTYPAVYAANEVEDVRLAFKAGKVVDASAARGEEFLISMLNMDEGSRCLGEAAFGLNYGIQRFTRNTLFDEKIGGTMHLALGQGFLEAGGQNQSGLHWDMICDLREGQVYVDGELVYEGGKFTI